LCNEKRGEELNSNVMDENNIALHYKFPLSEIINDFFDRIKTLTKGYGDY
jgi:GTP-binding protein LepA